MPTLEFEKVRSQLDDFLGSLLRAGRFHLKFLIQAGRGDGPEVLVEMDGEDADLLLAHGGEMLAALEHLAAKFLHLSVEEQSLLSFDCHDYKTLHEEELRLMAATAAERVARSSSPFSLNPMNSRDRRIIHLALKDHPSVRTESEGNGPGRKVVIYPQKQN
ncbi:MAG: single-stranded DNA-binding protein [Acidobacteria bacterium]|nr:single-stranded DNA-binding protein [Acidobacteriota bacterium]